MNEDLDLIDIILCHKLSMQEKCTMIENVWGNGLEIDIPDNESGETALTTAVSSYKDGESLDLILLLVDLGANINAQTNLGDTPLIQSIKVKMKENVMALLLRCGAQVHHVNKEGYSFLDYLDEVGCYASFDYSRHIRYWKRSEFLECIWEGKVETLHTFQTNLHATIGNDNIHDVFMMYNKNVPNPCGWTLLHAAVFLGHAEYVRIILMYLKTTGNLDWSFKTSNCKLQTALIIACAKGFTDIILLFREVMMIIE